MNVYTFFALGFAPGLFWLAFFYWRDKLEREPKSLIIKSFLLGVLIAVPAAVLNTMFNMGRFLTPVLVAPIVEEFLKFLVLRLYCYRKKEFNEPMDGIMYGAAVALGFASIENVSYLHMAHTQGIAGMTFLVRALFSVPGHALFTGMAGYALGMWKIHPRRVGEGFVLKGLFVAMALHSIFNLVASVSLAGGLGLLVFAAVAWWMMGRRISRALGASPFAADEKRSRRT